MDKRLYYFLEQVNSSFEWEDIQNASEQFDEVLLFCFERPVGGELPVNVKPILINYESYSWVYRLRLMYYSGTLLKEIFSSLQYWKRPVLIVNALSAFARTLYLADEITKVYKKSSKTKAGELFYTFWFSDFANALSLCSRGSLKDKLKVSRVHGTDLYEYRVPVTGRIPFRAFFLKGLDRVYSVSATGTSYLQQKYPEFKDKFYTSYLGTRFKGLSPYTVTDELCIVSCAKVRNIKRVYLLAEALQHTSSKIKWVHFGGSDFSDPTYPRFESALAVLGASKTNVKVVLMGEVANEAILDYYTHHTVHAFVSLSETEGLPVSMMEAASCGIPIIATNVGGCKEIVTRDTGILIEKDFSERDFATLLDQFLSSEYNTLEFRQKVKSYWNKWFNSEFKGDFFKELMVWRN